MLASLYCRLSERLDSYLSFIDEVLLLANNTPAVIGMDSNASSSAWCNKTQPGWMGWVKGYVVNDYIVQCDGLHVVNEPKEWYTFAGPNGRSDIDVTLTYGVGFNFNLTWTSRADLSISSHNIVEIGMNRSSTMVRATNNKRRWNIITDMTEYIREYRLLA